MPEPIRSSGSKVDPAATTDDLRQEIHIPIIQEEIVIGKELIETGKVRIEKSVTRENVSFDLSLTEENYKVVRIPKNEDVEVAPAIRHEGDTTIIPVVREVAVIRKKLVLVEEIHLRRTVVPHESTVHEVVRSEEIEIKRESLNNQKNNPTE